MTLTQLVGKYPLVKLGEVAEIDRKAVAPSEIADGTKFVGLEHIGRDGELAGAKAVARGDLGSTKFSFGPHHVLYGKLRPYLRKAARPDFVGICSTDILPILPRPYVDRDFLFHYLRSDSAVELATRRSSGANLPRLSPSAFIEFRLRLPPLAEQRRIAAILDKVDSVRRKREESMRLADKLLRSIFLEMFGDPVSNPKGWPMRAIGDIASVATGNTPSRRKREYYGSSIEWIKSDNINTPGHVVTHAKESLSAAGIRVGRLAEPGSTLMTCIAGSPSCIGNVALTDRRVAFNQQINAITPRGSLDSAFLHVQLLLSKPLIQDASTDSMKGMVSKGRLSSLRVPLPPLDLQIRFGRWFHSFLVWQRRLSSAGHQTHGLSESLSRAAFGVYTP